MRTASMQEQILEKAADIADSKGYFRPDELIDCYKCHSRPAEWAREMKTPSGGTYLRGWCSPCLAGPIATYKENEGKIKKSNLPKARSNGDFRVPIGSTVKIEFEAMMFRRLAGGRYSVTTQNEKGVHIEWFVPAEAVTAIGPPPMLE